MIQIILQEARWDYLGGMKKLMIWTAILLVSCGAPMNSETVNYEGETIFIGNVDWSGLTSGSYGEWFIPEYQKYVVYSDPLADKIDAISDVEIKVFLGTWCEDSQFQVPQFMKILDYLKFDQAQLQMVALERLEDKTLVSPEGIEQQYKIHFVPTYIFERGGIEIGRITEFPQSTLEGDMAEILGK